MNIANLNKNNTKMPYKQLSFILTIFILLTLSSACSPAINPPDNNDEKTVFTPSLHIKVSDGSSDITESLTIKLDENDSTKIIISGLVNSIGAENKTNTLTITPLDNIFSTTDGNDISIEITDPDGFISGPGVPLPDTFTITNDIDPDNSIRYTVVVPFSAAPVKEWLTSGSLSEYIKVTFPSQAPSLILNGTTLSVNGLYNADSGIGSISFDLPKGYEATPESIPLPDPDGTATETITLVPNTFTIRETGNPGNSQEYTIGEITFDVITVFTPRVHITITDNSPTPNVITDITINVNTENLITITGLSNAVGEKKAYTLTIEPVQGLFSTSSGNEIIIAITEPDGFSPGDGVLTQGNDVLFPDQFTITNDIDPSTSIIYTVVVPFSGALVQDWLTEMTFDTYFTGATYAGQTASLLFEGNTIAIRGDIINVPDGVISLTTSLPFGYSVMGLETLSVQTDGSGLAALTNAPAGTITITEGNTDYTKDYDVTISLAAYESPVMASHISVTGFDESSIDIEPNDILIEQNIITISALANGTSGTGSVTITPPTDGYTIDPATPPLTFDDPPGTDMAEPTVGTVDIESALGTVSHTVKLNLEAYESPVEASHVTAMFNGISADPSKIDISGTNITIRGFTNLDGSTDSGFVSITPTAGYTINEVPNPFSLSFTDPEGTDSQDIVAGKVSVRSAGVIASHTIIIKFSAPISLIINSNKIPSGTVTILKSGTVTLEGLNACELLTQPTFEVDGNPVIVTGFPRYFDRRMGTAPYTVTRDLIIEDANGDVLDEDFTVSVAGFPACNDATNVFTNTGDDADNAIEIDTAPKLELLSYLVENDNANYASKSYKLTVDIDLGLADLPWSEDASGETDEGFPPIGRTASTSTFQGTFDCANNSISNLYINKANDINIGLFGSTSGASILNCSLENVNVTGHRFVGGLVGGLNSSSIENSYATGKVEGTPHSAGNVGGLAGSLDDASSITNSYATGTVSGFGTVGGLVGSVYSLSSITNSYATSSVSGTSTVGGLAGYLSSSRVTNSYATGDVEGTTESVGGLAGSLDSSSIENSYATGDVEGKTENVGGLAGYLYTSSIENSYATGSVSGSVKIGGLAGYLASDSSITNSYATGSVSLGTKLIGGLVGWLNSSSIENSYATGSVTGLTSVGGLAGSLDDASSITNSYATGNVSGTENIGIFIGFNGNDSPPITIIYGGVTDSYYNNEAVLTVSGIRIVAKGVGSDDTSAPATTTGGLTGLSISALQVAKGTTAGEPYSTWPEASWLFMVGQYPRLIPVVCPNRQYPTDLSNVPTACRALQ